MASPGYGKRSAPNQQPRTRDDFALLPTRERYVAGFIDHLPEGAAMSVKQLARQLPLYGQQAVSTALNALSVAGHLRRVRCAVGTGDEVRWAFRTFWSRTARDNEWWNAHLAAENAAQTTAPPPAAPGGNPTPPPPWAPTAEPPPAHPEGPAGERAPGPAAVPHRRTPLPAPDAPRSPRPPRPGPAPAASRPRDADASQLHDAEPALPPQAMTHAPPTRATVHVPPAEPVAPVPPVQGPVPATFRTAPEPGPSPAYLALARLGRDDHRLALSAHDCAALEPLATAWLARGVSVDYLTSALTAGLPAQIDSPAGLIRRRLTDKIPPQLPTPETARPGPGTPAPARRILIECTNCGRPGHPEALPDGLCRPCRHAHAHAHGDTATPAPAEVATVKARMANLRTLLKPV
ncbi:MarR family transcriptional regulator [Streptomyces sp. NPDC059698]|uniref:MarR family transcriptional regulator n=1 Tax=unclassified Streptomyces TaxID=2593676 RepID=UPI00095AD7E0|nr:MarR family transcriptional regulator [Streptomyces sp. CB02366]OKJ41198.1 hypothetical protein AMK24_04940 [Streptomyces sp. CB02366]